MSNLLGLNHWPLKTVLASNVESTLAHVSVSRPAELQRTLMINSLIRWRKFHRRGRRWLRCVLLRVVIVMWEWLFACGLELPVCNISSVRCQAKPHDAALRIHVIQSHCLFADCQLVNICWRYRDITVLHLYVEYECCSSLLFMWPLGLCQFRRQVFRQVPVPPPKFCII